MKEITGALGVPFIYKSSFDKANRSSGKSFRGLGIEEGLRILGAVKKHVGVPVLTDVHEEDEIKQAAAVVDVLQTPAFLCRQTDFIRACAISGEPVNIKKGQFLAPGDMKNVIDKARDAAREAGLPEDSFMTCERGASFGYNNLVSDMRSLAIMRETNAPGFSTRRTRCSCRAARAQPAAVSASSFQCWRVRRLLQVSPVFSWKRIRIPPRQSPMGRMRSRSTACASCSVL